MNATHFWQFLMRVSVPLKTRLEIVDFIPVESNSTDSIALLAHCITVLSFDKAHSGLKVTMAEFCFTECEDVFLSLCLWLHLSMVLNHNNTCTFESQILIKTN